MNKVTLDKISVAERQIDTAIWLWFNESDVVSIVSLAGAALGVLDALFQHKKRGRPIPFVDDMGRLAGITPRQAREFVKADEVFAKHARTDAEKTREYCFDRASCYLFCAVAAYGNLTNDYGHRGLRSLFCLRYGIMHPELDDPLRNTVQTPEQRLEVERLKSLSRAEFFKEQGGDFVGNPPRPDVWP